MKYYLTPVAFQDLWIALFGKKKNIICGIIYRQHDSPESFQSYLDEVLERISSNDKTVHVMGDLIQPKPLQR